MSVTKQRSSAGKSVAIFFIVFIILEGLIIFGVSRIFKNKDVTPSIAGYSMYIMDSDAMGDAVPKGSLVIASNGAPSQEGVKKAVLAEEVPGIGTSVFWLADVGSDDNGVVYTVFQDNNPTKLYKLTIKNVIGTATTYYETAGKVLTFMTSKFGMIVLIASPLFLFVLLELIIMIVNHTRYSDDDDEYEDDEDDEDEDEKPVQLDDFLFGGENDKKLIKNRAQAAEDSVKEDFEPGEELPVRKAAKDTEEDYFEKTIREAAEARGEKPVEKVRKKAEEAAPAAEEAEEKAEEKAEEIVEEKAEEVKEAAKKKAPDIDPSYYEKASKLIDEGKAPEEPAPVKKAEPKPKPKPDMKSVSSSFEDLMKLMEAESDKLRSQLDDK